MLFVVLKRTGFFFWSFCRLLCRRDDFGRLAAESVQGATLALQGVDDVHGGDGFPLRVLGVGDGVTDDVLQEHFQHASGLLVDQTGNTLDAAATGKSSYCGLRDALDVVPEDFAVTLGASFSKTFSTFTATSHDESSVRAVSANKTTIVKTQARCPYL